MSEFNNFNDSNDKIEKTYIYDTSLSIGNPTKQKEEKNWILYSNSPYLLTLRLEQ